MRFATDRSPRQLPYLRRHRRLAHRSYGGSETVKARRMGHVKVQVRGVATLETLPSDHCVSPCPSAMPRHSAERPLRVTLPPSHCVSLCRAPIACHTAWHLLRVMLPRHHALTPCRATMTRDYASRYARHHAAHSVVSFCRDTLACHSSCHILPPYLSVTHVRHLWPVDLSGAHVTYLCHPYLSSLSASTTCQASMAVASGGTYAVYTCRTYLPRISAWHLWRQVYLADLVTERDGMDACHTYCDTLSGIYAGHTCQASCRGRVRDHIDA